MAFRGVKGGEKDQRRTPPEILQIEGRKLRGRRQPPKGGARGGGRTPRGRFFSYEISCHHTGGAERRGRREQCRHRRIKKGGLKKDPKKVEKARIIQEGEGGLGKTLGKGFVAFYWSRLETP